MSLKTKKHFKNVGKIISIILFVILFAFNIQIATNNNSSEGVNFMGYQITFINNLLAAKPGIEWCDEIGCNGPGPYLCAVILNPEGGYIYCSYHL